MIVVGRPISGVSINGLEFLLTDDRQDYLKFKDVPEAKGFLRENAFPEATDEELEDYFQFLEESDVPPLED